jgi:hypothetical protein
MVPLGCGCLFAFFVASAPRLALLFMWIFTPLVDRAFATFVGPLLGLAFLPFTTIIYVVLFPVVGFEWFWVGLGVMLDLGSYAAHAASNRSQIEGLPAGYSY